MQYGKIATSLVIAILAGNVSSGQRANNRYQILRHQLVERDIIGSGIKDERVIASIRNTPRHEFVPARKRDLAYYDMAIPIGFQQTISPPFIVAYMTEQLETKPTDKVLEIGTGSGYQAAVLSPLVKEVYSIEIVKQLGVRAASVLKKLRYKNVHTKVGDGYLGWPEHAPFDKIIVTCSPENIPKPLVEQLVEGGHMVIPLGERFSQHLIRFTKKGGELQQEVLRGTFFVPMTGAAEEERQVLPATSLTPLVNGSFEETIKDSKKPVGWYYVRQGTIEEAAAAPDGKKVLVFQNETKGRHGHALQAFKVDGREIRTMTIQLQVRGGNFQQGNSVHEQPKVFVEFYGPSRAPVGSHTIGPLEASTDWTQINERLRVPGSARLAVMGIGLFGAAGNLSIDDVKVSISQKR